MALLDLHEANGDEFPEPEVCVIGAGAAGIVLATELARHGKRVVLLEGGGQELEGDSQALYEGATVGHRHEGIRTGRYRTYGGTTTRWGGQLLELDREDFVAREWVPGSGWPLSKGELDPFYRRALSVEGMTGVETDDEQVWRRLGSAPPDVGEHLRQYFTRWAPEPNFARLHEATLERSANLMVYLHANAVELMLDAAGLRVRAVKCRTLAGKETEFRAGSFVLCMGGIETVRFLLQPHRNPWSSHPLLGRHFQDHPATVSASIRVLDGRRFQYYFSNARVGGWKYHPRLKPTAEVQRRERLLDATAAPFATETEAMVRVKIAAKALVNGRLQSLRANDVVTAVTHFPAMMQRTWHVARHGRIHFPSDAPLVLGVQCEQEPLGKSSLRLINERDALGLLRVAVDWQISDLELRTVLRSTQLVQSWLHDRKIAEVTIDPELENNLADFRSKCHDSSHHMGGVRMGKESSEGLVDSHLRLHGTDNVYVCSTGVFPTSGTSNPTHTVIALAVRLADALARMGGAKKTIESA